MFKVDKNMNIDDFVDECFQFVVDQQPDSSSIVATKVPRGEARHEHRVAKLRTHLSNTKKNIYRVSFSLSTEICDEWCLNRLLACLLWESANCHKIAFHLFDMLQPLL